MIGSIIKYSFVAVLGGIGFCAAAHYMDAEQLDNIRHLIKTQEVQHAALSEADRHEQVKAFIIINRANWQSNLTFAVSIDELNEILTPWL